MHSKIIIIITVLLLAGCNTTPPPAYQADREPENRDTYNGVSGLVQKQKDQNYLQAKALSDKCYAAKVDLAVAKSNNDEDEITHQQNVISLTCV